jgi:hypothetical protein
MNARAGLAGVTFTVIMLAGCSGAPQSNLTPSTASSSAAAFRTTAWTYVDLGPGPNGKDAFGYGESPTAQSGTYYDHSISCGKACSAKVYYPLAWAGPGSKPVVILPQFYVEGWAYGAGGTLIVGTLITNDGGYFGYHHAALWQGSSYKFTDLNPAGSCGSCSPGSNAYGTDGKSIGGSSGDPEHAMLWKLAQLKAPVDLNPGGFAFSEAYAVRGTAQAGYAYSTTTNSYHAFLWNGTAASAVDLTTSTLSSAYATGLGYKSEVGCGTPAGMSVSHALLWHGTAASMIDLQPSGFTDSCARAASGNVQVGYGHFTSTNALHALLWKGSAKTSVDLQQYLPNTFTSSEAYAIDTAGSIVGSAFSSTTNTWHAVIWVP